MKIWAVVLGLCFAALGAGAADAQPILLWEQGTLNDVRGMRRVVVVAPDAVDRAAIAGLLRGKQGLRVVRGGSAQFQVNYECSTTERTILRDPSTAVLNVYVMRGDHSIVAWKRSESIATCRNAAARTTLVKEFLKEFAGVNGKK